MTASVEYLSHHNYYTSLIRPSFKFCMGVKSNAEGVKMPCCRQIKIWMTKNKLKLNEQKTEVLLCGPSSRRETVPVDCLSFQRGENTWSNFGRGAFHGTTCLSRCQILFFPHQISSKVRPYITYKAASSIAICLILSKLDYCNSLLSGLPQTRIKRLQAVQNAAARTVMK